jgi:ribosome biogenesis protein ERB1
MAPVAGPSNPRKRGVNGQERASKAVEPSFGALELGGIGQIEEGSVDEDYSSDDDDDEADFPEIDAGSDDEEDEEDEDFDGDDSEEEQILRELAEEEDLERDLQDTSDSSFSSDAEDDIDDDDPDALGHAIRKAITRPNENYDASESADQVSNKNSIMGYDTREYFDRALKGKSAITGQDRMTWAEIEPGWESDEGAEEGPNRVGKIPEYFYDGMPHVGYDIDGKRIMRPVKGDELDKFLASIEDPSSW